jgi:hypothetical protein
MVKIRTENQQISEELKARLKQLKLLSKQQKDRTISSADEIELTRLSKEELPSLLARFIDSCMKMAKNKAEKVEVPFNVPAKSSTAQQIRRKVSRRPSSDSR